MIRSSIDFRTIKRTLPGPLVLVLWLVTATAAHGQLTSAQIIGRLIYRPAPLTLSQPPLKGDQIGEAPGFEVVKVDLEYNGKTVTSNEGSKQQVWKYNKAAWEKVKGVLTAEELTAIAEWIQFGYVVNPELRELALGIQGNRNHLASSTRIKSTLYTNPDFFRYLADNSIELKPDDKVVAEKFKLLLSAIEKLDNIERETFQKPKGEKPLFRGIALSENEVSKYFPDSEDNKGIRGIVDNILKGENLSSDALKDIKGEISFPLPKIGPIVSTTVEQSEAGNVAITGAKPTASKPAGVPIVLKFEKVRANAEIVQPRMAQLEEESKGGVANAMALNMGKFNGDMDQGRWMVATSEDLAYLGVKGKIKISGGTAEVDENGKTKYIVLNVAVVDE